MTQDTYSADAVLDLRTEWMMMEHGLEVDLMGLTEVSFVSNRISHLEVIERCAFYNEPLSTAVHWRFYEVNYYQYLKGRLHGFTT